ncbi:nickel-dependent hydrogenase large subunit [Candidatus Woesearchaeota archaeon]|nr:nickel-dependent hydrogenase large subunit [Candidatus Woesearchaeota archaeon]
MSEFDLASNKRDGCGCGDYSISLDHLTKIEGHASLKVTVREGRCSCELSVVEGSRLFEGMVKNRYWFEIPEIVSRICGICSTSHVLASVKALEQALGLKPCNLQLLVRKLCLIAEHLRSHATHLYLLALPDYLNKASAIELARHEKHLLLQGLRLINIGNAMLKTFAGREIHPLIFFGNLDLQSLDLKTINDLLLKLEESLELGFKTVKLFARFESFDLEKSVEWFSLASKDYAIMQGSLKSLSKVYDPESYKDYIEEYHVPYSTANHVVKEGKTYFVGALARLNNNLSLLTSQGLKALQVSGLKLPSTNAFDNNKAQAVEIVERLQQAIIACKDLKTLLSNKRLKSKEFKAFQDYLARLEELKTNTTNNALEGERVTGIGCVEAPRGVLWHEYHLTNGRASFANIVTPTAQNLKAMELDIKNLVLKLLNQGFDKDRIVFEIEKLIRAYDPCFSCSTHFLRVEWC